MHRIETERHQVRPASDHEELGEQLAEASSSVRPIAHQRHNA